MTMAVDAFFKDGSLPSEGLICLPMENSFTEDATLPDYIEEQKRMFEGRKIFHSFFHTNGRYPLYNDYKGPV